MKQRKKREEGERRGEDKEKEEKDYSASKRWT